LADIIRFRLLMISAGYDSDAAELEATCWHCSGEGGRKRRSSSGSDQALACASGTVRSREG
jgi:hypothetical protein